MASSTDSPTIAELTADPHAAWLALRSPGGVAWVEALGGWVVTGHTLAIEVMRDAATFTVDDPRFTTSQVIGRSMLSADGPDHDRFRQPFVAPFSLPATRERFTDLVDAEVDQLISALLPYGEAEFRTALAAPLAVACMAQALGLQDVAVADLLGWYEGIVGAVSDITAGAPLSASGRSAYAGLAGAIEQASNAPAPQLTLDETLSNTAVLLFGGIETTEGMVANVLYHLLSIPDLLAMVRAHPELIDAVIDESLRMEPAAAEVDRYVTRNVVVGDVSMRAGDLVVVSLAAANRDPDVFDHPHTFNPTRANARRHLAFAQGPHTCLGSHLARMETRSALTAVLGLPGLRWDDVRSSPPVGLVFRKPGAIWGVWPV